MLLFDCKLIKRYPFANYDNVLMKDFTENTVENTVISTNFHTRKLDEITVLNTVKVVVYRNICRLNLQY